MQASTSKWKKIQHSITFIRISKKCAISRSIEETKKTSRWRILRWEFEVKYRVIINNVVKRNIVTAVFYMLRSILNGLKLSYCIKETCTYTTSRLTCQSHTTSKWRKIEHSINFISYTKQNIKRKTTKSPVKENWKILMRIINKRWNKMLELLLVQFLVFFSFPKLRT